MLSKPTTDQVLIAIADDLAEVVAPACADDRATVLLGQIDQLLRRLARRSAHEIGWMHEEMAAIEAALDGASGATGEALATFRAAPADSVHLVDVVERYSLASAALSAAIDEAFASRDLERVGELRALIGARIANEQEVLGTLDLVGRG